VRNPDEDLALLRLIKVYLEDFPITWLLAQYRRSGLQQSRSPFTNLAHPGRC
jgi:hypothetical protein